VDVPTVTYYALLLAPCGEWNISTRPSCTLLTLILEGPPTSTLPVTTSSAATSSNLRTHLNQLPLLHLRTQATSYIPSHLQISNDNTYTLYDERYCPSCQPIKIVCNKLHTLLLDPHSSALSHPATLGRTRALRRYDLCSWSSHTPLQQNALLLGSTPPKIFRKFDKAWIHSISTFCTELLHLVQSHFLKHQPPASPGPVPSLPCLSASPPPEDTQCQVCQSPFDEEKMHRFARASAVLLFYTDQMNRVHSSEEALCNFTMAPCVVVERLEGKKRQRGSRGAVREHAGIQAQE